MKTARSDARSFDRDSFAAALGGLLVSAGPIQEHRMPAWRAAADELRAAWSPALAQSSGRSAVGPVDEVIDTIQFVLGRVVSRVAGHGPEHIARVLANAERLAVDDHLDELDAARVRLAAVTHDLGRVVLDYDGPNLRHAEASAVLLTRLDPLMTAIPGYVRLPAGYAVLVHSADSRDAGADLATCRVVGDLRAADSLDFLGPMGPIRKLVHMIRLMPDLSFSEGASFELSGIFDNWTERVERMNPIAPSASAAARAEELRSFGRDLIGRAQFGPGDQAAAVRLVRRLIAEIEPSVPFGEIEGLVARIAALPAAERGALAAILGALAGRLGCAAEEERAA